MTRFNVADFDIVLMNKSNVNSLQSDSVSKLVLFCTIIMASSRKDSMNKLFEICHVVTFNTSFAIKKAALP